jgi:hypothetical protein
MIIAFDNTLPDKAKVAELFAASGLSDNWDAGRFMQAAGSDNCRMIAAYDRQELVGVGRFVESGEADADGAQLMFDIVVKPDYRSRDIVGTMVKLLKKRRRLPAQTV